MRFVLFLVFLMVCDQLIGQTKFVDSSSHKIDSVKKVPKIDSALFYPDSTIIKIPARLIPAYLEVCHGNSDNILVGQLKEIIALTEQQTNKQLVKKPKK